MAAHRFLSAVPPRRAGSVAATSPPTPSAWATKSKNKDAHKTDPTAAPPRLATCFTSSQTPALVQAVGCGPEGGDPPSVHNLCLSHPLALPPRRLRPTVVQAFPLSSFFGFSISGRDPLVFMLELSLRSGDPVEYLECINIGVATRSSKWPVGRLALRSPGPCSAWAPASVCVGGL